MGEVQLVGTGREGADWIVYGERTWSGSIYKMVFFFAHSSHPHY